MAYITQSELRALLPNEGRPLDDPALNAIIKDYVDRAEEENANETAVGRIAVTQASRADALEAQFYAGGQREVPDVSDLRTLADKNFDRHNARGQGVADTPVSTSAPATVTNISEEPLWRGLSS